MVDTKVESAAQEAGNPVACQSWGWAWDVRMEAGDGIELYRHVDGRYGPHIVSDLGPDESGHKLPGDQTKVAHMRMVTPGPLVLGPGDLHAQLVAPEVAQDRAAGREVQVLAQVVEHPDGLVDLGAHGLAAPDGHAQRLLSG